jgi:short-subunit dehydrogenase
VAIHISSRSPPQQLANQWKSDIPHHNFHTYQIDLLDSQSIARSVELIRQKQIRFDVIVANAAYGADYGQTIPSEETARNTIATNVISTIDFIKQFIPLL